MKHFVFAGRYGDICHSIPAAYEYFKRTGERVRFTAAQEFVSILSGCSYIEPVAAPVPWQQINDVLAHSKKRYPQDDFTVMACYGKDYSPGYYNWSFLRDSWRLSQCPLPPETVDLVFDKRNLEREQRLIQSFGIKPDQKIIVVCVAGKSSPFHQGAMLLEDIRRSRPDCQLVDVSSVRAECPYDLIGIFERAEALVTIDTLHLHLSAAVPSLPVYALICDGPTKWNRSDWRPQQVWRCRYSEYASRRLEFQSALKSPRTPQIQHVWSDYVAQGDTMRRMEVARQSWSREGMWAKNWKIGGLVPKRTMPEDSNLAYVKELFDFAASLCEAPEDIISVSNADVGCVHGITGQILDACRESGCAFTHRYDFNGVLDKPLMSEAEVRHLSWYPGSDWFWCTKTWWEQHRDEMPDMVIGREYWDCVLRQIMKKHRGVEILRAIWHEKHPSRWEQSGLRNTLPGNVHNAKLAGEFFKKNSSDNQDPFRTTWNIQPGITQPYHPDPNSSPTRVKSNNNVIRPIRFQDRFRPTPKTIFFK